MQRDFGDELLIAVVAIGVIAFAVVFGILLSLVGAPSTATLPTAVVLTETFIPTDVVPTAMTAQISVPTARAPDATSTSDEMLAATETAAETPASDSPTEASAGLQSATPDETALASIALTRSPALVATNTQFPAVATAAPVIVITVTLTPTMTDTDARTDTPTNTPDPTATDTEQPTATDTPQPTVTDTATRTPAPTATDTEQPTATDTPQPTVTVTPTATITDTSTPSLTSTLTASSTHTHTPTVTLTRTAAVTASPTAVPTGTRDQEGLCRYPPRYSRHIAGPQETIDSLADAAGMAAEHLRGANCFWPDAEIIAGDVIYLPQKTDATPTPDGTEIGWASIGCERPMLARITLPVQGAVLSGKSQIIGTAFASDFIGYRLELRRDEAVEYQLLRELQVPAVGSVLATLDVSKREAGLYWLRLVVVTAGGNIGDGAVCVVPIFISDPLD